MIKLINKNQRGFTLIELMVVITIISLLTSIVLTSLSTARVKTRDSVRIQTVKEVQKALELYYSDNGRYPLTGVTTGVSWTFLTLSGTGPISTYYKPILTPDPANGSALITTYAIEYVTNAGSNYGIRVNYEIDDTTPDCKVGISMPASWWDLTTNCW